MRQKVALVIGVTGQDGSYLAEHLLGLGYEVHGTLRSTTRDVGSSPVAHLIAGDEPLIITHSVDVTDSHSILRVLEAVQPDEVYNLAAQSHVAASFDQPIHTGSVTGLGCARILEGIRKTNPAIRYYQAGSSEMFGSTTPPQKEDSPFHPRSPYAVAKVYAYWITVNYRESFGLHASNGILFNHESPRRGPQFVTRKITSSIPKLITGQISHLRLGNLDARRDWGHARDYVKAMHLMLQYHEPLDLVIGTGESRSVRDFLDQAFGMVDLEWLDYVSVDASLFRPADPDHLLADASLAAATIGWRPETSFKDLVSEMLREDMSGHGLSLD